MLVGEKSESPFVGIPGALRDHKLSVQFQQLEVGLGHAADQGQANAAPGLFGRQKGIASRFETVHTRVSGDGAKTWGDEIILRDDGGSWDLGYPRMHVRPDGSLITVYYINRRDDPIQCDGGVRHIAATIWEI